MIEGNNELGGGEGACVLVTSHTVENGDIIDLYASSMSLAILDENLSYYNQFRYIQF